MELLKSSFAVQSLDDKVLTIGNASMPADTSVLDLVANNPQYWTEMDTDNIPHLCTVKTDQAPLPGSFRDINNNTYQLTAKAFVMNEFFGGHPKERPRAI